MVLHAVKEFETLELFTLTLTTKIQVEVLCFHSSINLQMSDLSISSFMEVQYMVSFQVTSLKY